MTLKRHLTLSYGLEIRTSPIRAFAAACLWVAVKWGVRSIAAITGASGVRHIFVLMNEMPTDSGSNAIATEQGARWTIDAASSQESA